MNQGAASDAVLQTGETSMTNHKFTTLATAVVVVIAASCGSEGDEGAATSGDTPAASEAGPASTDAGAPTSAEVPATTTDAPATDAPATDGSSLPNPDDAAPEPLPLTGNIPLDGGSTYRTETLDPEVTFSIPADHGERSWRSLFATPSGFVIVALQEEKTPGVPDGSQPGMQVAPVVDGVTADEVVASVMNYAGENPAFDVAAETGMIAGSEVTVLRGTSFDTGDGLVEVPTSADSRFVLPTGPREFLVYLLDGPSGLVAVVLDAHELEFDFLISRTTPILDSLEIS